MMEEAERSIPWWKLLALSACFLGVIVADVLNVRREGKRDGGEGDRDSKGST